MFLKYKQNQMNDKLTLQLDIQIKIQCVVHHGATGLLHTSSFLKKSNSEGYNTAWSYSPIKNARKRIFQNILARDRFEPSNTNPAFCVLKITVSLNSDESTFFLSVTLGRGYIQRLNVERPKKKAVTKLGVSF